MGKEMKPCPFCGSEAEVRRYRTGRYGANCSNDNCPGFWNVGDSEQEVIDEWNKRVEKTCHMTLRKSGPRYDVWFFDCCEKEWVESRCDEYATELPGTRCPWCGAKVVE